MTEKEHFFRGAKVTNRERLALRALNTAMMADLPQWRRPSSHPDAIALAHAHPRKGWAKRYLRARGLPL